MNESSSIIIQRGKYAIIEYRATEIGPPASDTNVKCHEALVKAGWILSLLLPVCPVCTWQRLMNSSTDEKAGHQTTEREELAQLCTQ